jgi:hypothetical protein
VLAVMLGAVALFVSAAAAGGFEFRIYDPSHFATQEVGTADVIRSSARVYPQPGGRAYLYFSLTKQGAGRFRALTRSLAHRGAVVHRKLPFVLEIDGRVRGRPLVDYTAFPDGLDPQPGVEITGLPLAVARVLATIIRGR